MEGGEHPQSDATLWNDDSARVGNFITNAAHNYKGGDQHQHHNIDPKLWHDDPAAVDNPIRNAANDYMGGDPNHNIDPRLWSDGSAKMTNFIIDSAHNYVGGNHVSLREIEESKNRLRLERIAAAALEQLRKNEARDEMRQYLMSVSSFDADYLKPYVETAVNKTGIVETAAKSAEKGEFSQLMEETARLNFEAITNQTLPRYDPRTFKNVASPPPIARDRSKSRMPENEISLTVEEEFAQLMERTARKIFDAITQQAAPSPTFNEDTFDNVTAFPSTERNTGMRHTPETYQSIPSSPPYARNTGKGKIRENESTAIQEHVPPLPTFTAPANRGMTATAGLAYGNGLEFGDALGKNNRRPSRGQQYLLPKVARDKPNNGFSAASVENKKQWLFSRANAGAGKQFPDGKVNAGPWSPGLATPFPGDPVEPEPELPHIPTELHSESESYKRRKQLASQDTQAPGRQ